MMKIITEIKNFCKQWWGTDPDCTKFSLEDVKIICNMWATWKANPKLYKSQREFAKAVNSQFGTHKSHTTIVRLVRKNQ